ncbi:MAG: hypothetical protein QOE31_83 [Solirubrobacteraceae bacterium]|nr:hypothetical protein [Solirubrobacteraceae bacterium]
MRRIGLAGVLAMLLTLLGLTMATPGALANSTLGSFEIDGNRADDSGTGEPIDWFVGVPNTTTLADPAAPNDDIFLGTQTEPSQATWNCGPGTAPPAEDITQAQMAFRQLGPVTNPGDLFGYMSYFRGAGTPDAHVDFEINKSNTPVNANCPNLVARTVGDVLIALDQNGSALGVRAFKWNGTAFVQSATTAATADGAVNVPPSLTIPGRANGTHGEAAINLTQVLGGIGCGQFTGVYAKSRSGAALDSPMRDFTKRQAIRPGHCPESALTKGVRNVTATPTGDFVSDVDADTGDTIEYKITYTNSRSGQATNVKVTDTIAAGTTYVPGSCTPACTVSGTTITWNLGTVPGNSTRTMTFKVTASGPFAACDITVVKNVAQVMTTEEGTRSSNETRVTVRRMCSNLTIRKDANRTQVSAGDTITYTLTYGNTGPGAATTPTITDTLPAGTQFTSCTGGCTNNNGTVTWTVPTVASGGTGSVTLTVTVRDDIDSCTICNVAKIASASQAAAVTSPQACVAANPAPDPSTATARGDAVGLHAFVPLLGIPLLNVDISRASSSQTGPGQSADDEEFASLTVGGVGTIASIARASVLRSTSTSNVTRALGARQTSTSEVLGLNLLDGLVTADVVRSVASTTATGNSSSFSAAGSTAANLRISGASVANVAPGTHISLPPLAFGVGSYVAVNEQTGTTSGPAAGQLSGGTYRADLTVTAIRVHVTGGLVGTLLVGLGPPADITVARATAHSDHKQTRVCTTNGRTQAVSGHAFIASAQVNPLLPTSTVGYVEIPASGGSAHMGVAASVLPNDGSIVATNDAATDTTGTNGATSSTASSYAQTAGACVLRAVASNCLISATLIRSQANSSANATTRSSNASGTQFINLVVAGIPIIGTPQPNTVIPLAGLGFVILNEQVADGPQTGHTGLTVRAIRVRVTLPLAPLLRGAEVIVAEAHSDATFR